jgi:hypothetical protein
LITYDALSQQLDVARNEGFPRREIEKFLELSIREESPMAALAALNRDRLDAHLG